MRPDVPAHLQHLPTDHRGYPVPNVAAWSSEWWQTARPDPSVEGRVALYTAGRIGVGRPVLSIVNEPRQRRSVWRSLCQVCDRRLDPRDAWIVAPHIDLIDEGARRGVVTTSEAPCCAPCADYALATCCGIRDQAASVIRWPDVQNVPSGRATMIVWPMLLARPIMQMLNPTVADPRRANRFDGKPTDAEIASLGRQVQMHGGIVGLLKLELLGVRLADEQTPDQVALAFDERALDQRLIARRR